jgi:hypothetical protein
MELEAQTPVERVEGADPGQSTLEARERDSRRELERLLCQERRPEQLSGEGDGVSQGTVETLRGPLEQLRLRHAEWCEDPVDQGDDERPTGALGQELAEGVEAGVRIDPARTRWGDHRVAVERHPRGMGEQVADGRARWAGRLVEVDRVPSTAVSTASAVATLVIRARKNGASRRR